MLLRLIPSPFDLPSSFLPLKSPPLLRWNPGIRDNLLQRKRCRRRRRPPEIQVRTSLDDVFQNLVAAFSSPESLDLLAPALGFASGAALFLSSLRRRRRRNGGQSYDADADPDAVIGDWILFTSPTPFNRCVLLRCPSVSFEDGGELMDGVHDRLVREERHYVNLSRGRIPAAGRKREDDVGHGEEVSYQRVCVGTDDGGVISLDWPDNLDLGREHGLDTTVLVVPGTSEGSMDRNVRMFVVDALKHGFFPVVMNPRGCAGSPLTTARLFTAADSDDISTAIQFVNKLRPWTTLMSVGWGYGANMLTKYLAEVGETTPLTAAVCVDNLFDLAEATRSFPHHIALDQKLTSGLRDILRDNKELFQGKGKRFNVGKALSATSVRDFDGAISMISHGCDSIENFYSKISTRQAVSSVKIPVLFIQSGDGIVPPFSVPRSSISENPFTSLLLCSCLPSTIIIRERSATLWCQNIAIEWLSAVELALLKGRHPVLKDVDITINPSKGLAFVDAIASERTMSDVKDFGGGYDPAQLFLSRKNHSGNTFMKLNQLNPVNGFLLDPPSSALEENDVVVQDGSVDHSKSGNESHDMQRNDNERRKENKELDALQQNSSEMANGGEEGDSSLLSEQSQVLQTASVVMNMLDVTMPGTLDDEQRKKVLTAMERGETLMKALEGAVPEDVRGKLTTAVAEILHTQGTNLNLDGIKKIRWIPNVTSEVKSRIQKFDGVATADSGNSGTHLSGQSKRDVGSEERTHHDSDSNDIHKSTETLQGKASQTSGFIEAGSEVGGKSNQPNKSEKASAGIDEPVIEQHRVDQNDGVAERQSTDDRFVANNGNDVHNNASKKEESVLEQNLPISSTHTEGAFSAGSSTSEQQVVEKEGNGIQKNEEKVSQDVVDQNAQSSTTKSEEPRSQSSSSPSITVTQALDALTGFDDSTQMAVNSVFGVLENMIDQLENRNNEGNDDEIDRNDNHAVQNLPPIDESNSERTEVNNEADVEAHVGQSSDQPKKISDETDANTHDGVEDKQGDNEIVSSIAPSAQQTVNQSPENAAGINHLERNSIHKVGHAQPCLLDAAVNHHLVSPYAMHLHGCLSPQWPIKKSSDLESTTDLFLDPEEGQWKMLDQAGNTSSALRNKENQSVSRKSEPLYSPSGQGDMEKVIEPSYVILDTEFSRCEQSSKQEADKIDGISKQADAKREDLMCLIKNTLLESLKVEVGRRLGLPDLKHMERGLAYDLEQVADAVSEAVVHDNDLDLISISEINDPALVKFGTLEGERLVKIISSAFQDAGHLRKVLPVGVIVGSSLASLRKHFQVVAWSDGDQSKTFHKSANRQGRFLDEHIEMGDEKQVIADTILNEKDQLADEDDSSSVGNRKHETVISNNNRVMAGAVTAALGASALLANHQIKEATEIPSASSNEKGFPHEEHAKLGEAMLEKNQNGLSSLAEKAMSVTAPVVPTKNDGEVDQERLVALLAELGQKGGILRLVGKIALLWGGIRGAMSLTDRLISFLRIAERPLLHRMFGFACMVLVLWSPVVIPLLPTLVQHWTTKASNGIAEYACIVGLYVSIMILVILWGKRIRKYDNPLAQYGLDLTSAPRVKEFFTGWVGGLAIVLCIHSVSGLLGYARFFCPFGSSSFGDPIMLLKAYGNVVILAVRGIITATGIALVEELLFRSWLAEEVAVDFGYYHGIVISGVVFSLLNRSLPSIPGFLLLSLALFGIKQRTHGKLAAPIGIRAGIMSTNFFLQTAGFIKYRPATPFWLASTHPMHPFDGVMGLSICVLLAIFFFPQQPPQEKDTGAMQDEIQDT